MHREGALCEKFLAPCVLVCKQRGVFQEAVHLGVEEECMDWICGAALMMEEDFLPPGSSVLVATVVAQARLCMEKINGCPHHAESIALPGYIVLKYR